MSPQVRSFAVRGALFVALLLAASGLFTARRAFIKRFFVDGAVASDAPVWPRAPVGEGLRPAARVRVVLLDGLTRSHALGLRELSAICAAGQELELDVGFPTVSLPVQHVLWTGRTQQQSGLQYHIGKLPEPPQGSTPRQVDSVVVAESHPEIVHSFGFTTALPPDAPVTQQWRDHGFPVAALAAVTSPAQLAFVHVLRVDEAGHAQGGASLAYGSAAAWSDALLGRLFAAAPADASTLWVVLADHGHRHGGGHGGAEPDIRLVRACVAGGGVAPGTGEARVLHLVDLARALADALGASLHPDAPGRPWTAALAEPARGATIPRPGLVRWSLACALLLLGVLSLRTGDSQPGRWTRRLPWLTAPLGGPGWLPLALGAGWLVLALLGVALTCGWPSLSNPVVYPPTGRDVQLGSLPALIALAALAGVAVRRWACSDGALLRAILVPWAALTLAMLVLCRGVDALLLGLPPLMPWSTGLASMLLIQGRAVCLLLAVLMAIRIVIAGVIVHRKRRAAAPRAASVSPP